MSGFVGSSGGNRRTQARQFSSDPCHRHVANFPTVCPDFSEYGNLSTSAAIDYVLANLIVDQCVNRNDCATITLFAETMLERKAASPLVPCRRHLYQAALCPVRLGSAIMTRSRPASFARSKAASAVWTSLANAQWDGALATPNEAVIGPTSRPSC
jgi:hypothetical protein